VHRHGPHCGHSRDWCDECHSGFHDYGDYRWHVRHHDDW
jgi:hypothetical protein